ncbi:MAG: c-type cytochrome [Verrucomicrobiales bacterium]|nr:c-type cytochrome [Verrucomicrobiales bacterium]
MRIVTFALLLLSILFPGGTGHSGEFRFKGGKPEAGKVAFERLNCIQCHQVNGVTLAEPKTKRILNLSLGKEIRFVKNYEDILTAITNPRHVVTEQYSGLLSKAELDGGIEAFMPNMIEDMSVVQLIDLAAFLDKVYSENLDEYPQIIE